MVMSGYVDLPKPFNSYHLDQIGLHVAPKGKEAFYERKVN